MKTVRQQRSSRRRRGVAAAELFEQATVTTYRENTSTSSEDDTSTAGAAATTADMCRRSKVCKRANKGVKVLLNCTGCGYTSDRQANVIRHYGRIHCQLKKYKKCDACGEVLQTKWEYYEHCAESHPMLRQSWYTTTHVYKLNQTRAKSKLKSVNKPSKKKESNKEPTSRVGLTTRSLTRVRNQEAPLTTCSRSDCDSSDGTEQELPLTTSPISSFSDFSSCQSSILNFKSDSTTSFTSKGSVSPMQDIGIQISFDWHVGNVIEEWQKTVERRMSHLPIKKRYSSSRKFLGDITSITNNVGIHMAASGSQDNNNNTQVPVKDMYSSMIDNKCRAFISHIDFDELDAILTLPNMKITV